MTRLPIPALPLAPNGDGGKARPVPDAPEPPPQAQARARRSLRLQVRSLRTLVFAAWLFARLLWWHWVVRRVRGDAYVQAQDVRRWKTYAREFRAFASGMGGVMIKLGQFISTRADIFPEEIIRELEGLQDEIPSIPYLAIERVLLAELGPLEARYAWLAKEPIAAASLGQVHRAKLLNGDRVVVKVQRPGIVDIIATDMASLLIVARVAMRFAFIRRRTDAVAVTEEFGRVLWQEVSYRHEAQNAQRFGAMFRDDMGVYVPTIYPEHSTDRVLTMEDVSSIKISDFAALDAAGVSRKAVAKRLTNTYLRQIFEERFFHADPHPGNLFVYPLPIDDPAADFGPEGRPFYLIFVDFGMTGTLTQQIVDGLMSTLVAVVTRDAGALVRSYQQLDLLLPGADVERLEVATKATFDQVWGMSMAELSSVDPTVVIELGREFNDLLFDMPFRVPQNFVYLGRTIGILSGMATTLDPSFNGWQELQPFARKLMRQQATRGNGDLLGGLVGGVLGGAAAALVEAGTNVVNRAINPGAPAEALVRQLQRGEVKITAEPSRKLVFELNRLEQAQRTTTRAVLFAAALVCSTLLLVADYTLAGAVGYTVSALVGWRVLFPPGLIR